MSGRLALRQASFPSCAVDDERRYGGGRMMKQRLLNARPRAVRSGASKQEAPSGATSDG